MLYLTSVDKPLLSYSSCILFFIILNFYNFIEFTVVRDFYCAHLLVIECKLMFLTLHLLKAIRIAHVPNQQFWFDICCPMSLFFMHLIKLTLLETTRTLEKSNKKNAGAYDM